MTRPKILITCIHWAVASGRYMSAAFRRIGCDVKTAGPYPANTIWGMQVDNKYNWNPDVLCDFGNDAPIGYVTTQLKRMCDGWQPDLVVNMDSAFDVVGTRQEYPCPKVLYGVDNHVRDYNRSPLSWYNHLFLAHHDGPVLPVDESREDMTWLPCGYDDATFTPSPYPVADKRIDVTMIGVPYTNRVNIIKEMNKADITIKHTLGALYEQYRDIYHYSKISLCVSAAGDLAQRVFETAAMGCVVLTDPLADLRRLGAVEGKHYVEYSDTQGAVHKAKELLKYPARMADIAAAGQAFFAPHTWTKRAYTIMEKMGL